MNKIVVVIGARPQFIKHAPVEIVLKNAFQVVSVHTGQHYDTNMSDVFFKELGMTEPAYKLNVGSHTHGKQTAMMLESIEEILEQEMPDGVLIYGDTNSTLAAALAASKMHIPVIHVEAGLRSFNKKMPEEVNRILTDHVSKILFAPTQPAVDNLRAENINEGVYMVGDVMADAVLLAHKYAKKEIDGEYILMTIHRPYNTDNKERLSEILMVINNIGKKVIFPIHPRTSNLMNKFGLDKCNFHNIDFIEPQSYFSNIGLLKHAICLITDSGGMQKEAYMVKTQCITIRSETEWVETLENGWNTLVFHDLDRVQEILKKSPGEYNHGLYGEGDASTRIVKTLLKAL